MLLNGNQNAAQETGELGVFVRHRIEKILENRRREIAVPSRQHFGSPLGFVFPRHRLALAHPHVHGGEINSTRYLFTRDTCNIRIIIRRGSPGDL